MSRLPVTFLAAAGYGLAGERTSGPHCVGSVSGATGAARGSVIGGMLTGAAVASAFAGVVGTGPTGSAIGTTESSGSSQFASAGG